MAGKGLGAGLGAIFGDDILDDVIEENTSAKQGDVTELPISRIEPRKGQPRSNFDEEALFELSESIKEHGLIQPITVRELDSGYYQIIAGERRWRASRMAGLTRVPVRILDADDRRTVELALVENLQREDLNIIEEAKGYRTLMEEYGMTQEETAETVGKSRPVIANALRLLGLPEKVLKLLAEGALSQSHARLILELKDPELQVLAAEKTVSEGLTVRALEALIKKLSQEPEEPLPIKTEIVDYVAVLEKDIGKSLGRKVRIVRGKKKGRIEIEYYGEDDFENICQDLKRFGEIIK